MGQQKAVTLAQAVLFSGVTAFCLGLIFELILEARSRNLRS